MNTRVFYWMHCNDVITEIKVTAGSEMVVFANKTDDYLLTAFGSKKSPLLMKDLVRLVEERIAPCRDETDLEIYRNLGCASEASLEELINLTQGVLVDDFFWFYEPKKEDIIIPDWREVRKSKGIDLTYIPTIPELQKHQFTSAEIFNISALVTRASQPKWTYKGWFIKLDRWGYEAMAEVLVSILAKYVKGIQCLEYVLLPPIKGRGVCASPQYTDQLEFEFVSFWNIIQKSGRTLELPSANINNGKDLLNKVIQIISEETGLNMESYIKKMLMWDALILNTDRHYNNMAVRRSNTGKYTSMPFFDHGLSLLSGYEGNDFTGVRARVYSDSFTQYINLAGEEHRLSIDMYGFCEHLNKLRKFYEQNETGYYARLFRKVSNILVTRLLDTKGVVWQAVGKEAYLINNEHFLEWYITADASTSELTSEIYRQAIHDINISTCLTNNYDDMAYGKH